MSSFFKVRSRSKRSKARLGTITTDHGVVQTPAFVPVGTKGTIKALPQSFFKDIGIQLSFVNTYHLVTHPGVEVLKKAGGIHKLANYNIPLMSDSGGFQVFSLAQRQRELSQKSKVKYQKLNSKIKSENRIADIRGDEQPPVVKISDDGVKFRSVYDGQLIEFTPESSMEFQRIIGADINMAFDECTYYPATHEYTEKAMKRTHEWLKRCVNHKKKHFPLVDSVRNSFPIGARALRAAGIPGISATYPEKHNQYLYGIIQGGTFEDLRVASAKFIQTQDVSGVAIGGVSVGESKAEMRKQVEWIAPYLPDDKPVHLLGVGHVDDIIDLVGQGIDTFDCVEPTRLARMGTIYQMSNDKSQMTNQLQNFKSQITTVDINKTIFKADMSSVNEGCECMVCQNYSKSYLHHLFKQREIVGYTLATYHNLWVMEKLMEKIREMVGNNLL